MGRSSFADIVIADASVAPHHAEIVVTDDGRMYLTDCGTETGTWRRRQEADGEGEPLWQSVRQGFIRLEEPLKLGDYLCTAQELIGGASSPSSHAGDGFSNGDTRYDRYGQRLRGRVERDPATGEIIRRRP